MNDKNLHNNLDSFLNDDSFISYVKNLNAQYVKYWDRWLLAHPEKVDVVNEAKLIINSIQFEEDIPTKKQIDRTWANISSDINIESQKPKDQKFPIYKIFIGIAAAILLVIFINGIWSDKDTFTTTSMGEISSLVLPDKSTVELNADSKISYNSAIWEKERKLTLKGEAFFNVKKGEKFSVKTDKVIVEVLGTSFNIFDRNNLVDVRCETGKVRVINSKLKDTILLNPGFGAKMFGNNKLEIYNFNVSDKNTWKDGIVSFQNQSLKFVFDEIERQYNVKINADNSIVSRKYTGQFTLGNLDKSLYSICWPMHLKYDIEKNKVNITNTN